jgi:hypothetical protein
VFRVDADDAHHALAVDHLAFVANLFDGRSNFHKETLFLAADKRRGTPITTSRNSKFLKLIGVYLRSSAANSFS